jgi:thioredoxin
MDYTEFRLLLDTLKEPLVVAVWADWCIPCKTTKPILESLATEFAGSVEFLTINADESPEIIQHYGIRGIPTVLILEQGELTARITGAKDQEIYRDVFASLAQGKQIEIKVTSIDRMIRIGTAIVILMVSLLTSTWIWIPLSGLLAFWGLYDRCPVWKALSGRIKRTP